MLPRAGSEAPGDFVWLEAAHTLVSLRECACADLTCMP